MEYLCHKRQRIYKSNTMSATCGSGTVSLPEHLSSLSFFQWVSCGQILSFFVQCIVDHCLPFCPFFFQSLYCLSFDLWLLITPLVSYNSSYVFCVVRINLLVFICGVSGKKVGAITYRIGVVVIVWQLDLQLPMQSVPITTKFKFKSEVYLIQHCVIKFVSDL